MQTNERVFFELNADHHRWAIGARRKYGHSTQYWLNMILRQRGRCAFSGVPLRFDALAGTALAGGQGVPLYAAVDHIEPGSDELGHEIVSYDLNDLKGPLPADCFADLRKSPSWCKLMQRWVEQAQKNPDDREALRSVRRKATTAASGSNERHYLV